MLNKVLMRVDFPRPDSPIALSNFLYFTAVPLTDYHNVKAKSFSNTLSVPLVGKVGETNVPSQLAPDNISHVICCGCSCFWVFRAYRLTSTDWQRRGFSDVGRCGFAIRNWAWRYSRNRRRLYSR